MDKENKALIFLQRSGIICIILQNAVFHGDLQRLGHIHGGSALDVLGFIDLNRRQFLEFLGDGPDQLAGALVGGGGNGEEGITLLLHVFAVLLPPTTALSTDIPFWFILTISSTASIP